MSRAPVALAKCCKMLIASLHHHDFVRCKCGKSFVDGGTEYRRWGGDIEWLKSADVERADVKKLLPAFRADCKKKAKRLEIENWEYAQRIYLEHGIATRDYFAPKPKGAKMPKVKKEDLYENREKKPIKGLYSSGEQA